MSSEVEKSADWRDDNGPNGKHNLSQSYPEHMSRVSSSVKNHIKECDVALLDGKIFNMNLIPQSIGRSNLHFRQDTNIYCE